VSSIISRRRHPAAGYAAIAAGLVAVGAGDEFGDLVGRDGHRRHGAGGEQHVGGEIQRHRVGDAMHARPPRADARQHVGGDVGKLTRRMHLKLPPPA